MQDEFGISQPGYMFEKPVEGHMRAARLKPGVRVAPGDEATEVYRAQGGGNMPDFQAWHAMEDPSVRAELVKRGYGAVRTHIDPVPGSGKLVNSVTTLPLRDDVLDYLGEYKALATPGANNGVIPSPKILSRTRPATGFQQELPGMEAEASYLRPPRPSADDANLMDDFLEPDARQLNLPDPSGPVETLAAGIPDKQLDYLRDGMRNMRNHRGAYEGASPEEIEQIATGQIKTKNASRPFEPVRINSWPDGKGGLSFELQDGRHRLQAAKEAGARNISANVHTHDGQIHEKVIIPVPR